MQNVNKIFFYFKTEALKSMYMISEDVLYNWKTGKSKIPAEVEADMNELIERIESR